MKDIFIDANIAAKFAKPPTQHYKDLIDWLLRQHVNKADNAFLVVSDYLKQEYHKGNCHCNKQLSILNIVFTLQAKGQLNFKTKDEIEAYKNKNINKTRWNKFRSKSNDKNHIPLVLLSNRQMVLSEDVDFLTDLINFPGNNVVYAKVPEKLNYK